MWAIVAVGVLLVGLALAWYLGLWGRSGYTAGEDEPNVPSIRESKAA